MLSDGITLKEWPEIYLEFENGETVLLPSIDPEWVKTKKTIWVEERKERLANGLEIQMAEYNIDRCGFFVKGTDVVRVHGYGGIVAIWDESETNRYELPLSYPDLMELFGKPDEARLYYCE